MVKRTKILYACTYVQQRNTKDKGQYPRSCLELGFGQCSRDVRENPTRDNKDVKAWTAWKKRRQATLQRQQYRS